ncbi:DUF1870 family protein, partial [Escherichia coli]|uniref:Aca2/YdiL-like domain-containing protein n=1 Tax=Escherichia coli TaxID=562 RepID=UPI003EE3ACEF
HAIIEKINNRIGNNTMRFFPDLTAFQQVYPDGNFIDWKIYQSAPMRINIGRMTLSSVPTTPLQTNNTVPQVVSPVQ